MYLGEWGEISSKQGWERQIRLIWPESGDIAAFADSEVKILPFAGVLSLSMGTKKPPLFTECDRVALVVVTVGVHIGRYVEQTPRRG